MYYTSIILYCIYYPSYVKFIDWIHQIFFTLEWGIAAGCVTNPGSLHPVVSVCMMFWCTVSIEKPTWPWHLSVMHYRVLWHLSLIFVECRKLLLVPDYSEVSNLRVSNRFCRTILRHFWSLFFAIFVARVTWRMILSLHGFFLRFLLLSKLRNCKITHLCFTVPGEDTSSPCVGHWCEKWILTVSRTIISLGVVVGKCWYLWVCGKEYRERKVDANGSLNANTLQSRTFKRMRRHTLSSAPINI